MDEQKQVLRAVDEWLERKHFYQARAVLQTLAQNDPGNAEIVSRLALCLAMGFHEYESALQLMQKIIDKEVYNPRWYVVTARIYEAKKDRFHAIKMIDEALRWDPGYRPALNLRQKMGIRRTPIFRFLPRVHPLNKFFGRLRHRITRGS